MKKAIISSVIVLLSTVSYAQDAKMKKEDFNLPLSIKVVESIGKSLDAFNNIVEIFSLDEQIEQVTEEKQTITINIDSEKINKLEKSELTWRKLNLINPNNILRVKGTLLKMQMELCQTRYENATLRKEKSNEKEIGILKQDCRRAKENFEQFINTHSWYE